MRVVSAVYDCAPSLSPALWPFTAVHVALGLLIWRVPGSPMGGTTGVSLEQGLGLTDVPRGCPGRRSGDERSYAPDYYFVIYKINPSARSEDLSPGS